MPKLVVTEKGQDKEKSFDFGRELVLIGRSESCDVCLPNNKISRQHAKVVADGTDYFLVDLESGNGTFLNSIPVKPNEKNILRHNDIISIENFHLRFNLIDELLHQSFNDITDSDILEVKLLKKVLRALDKERIPSLEVLNGSAEGKKVFLNDEGSEMIIGRDPLIDFPIEEYVISRQHAKISKKWGEVVVTDLNSKNGTFVNNKKIVEEVLHDGDRISLGTIVLIFRNPKEVNIQEISERITERRLKEAPPVEPSREAAIEADKRTEEELKEIAGEEAAEDVVAEEKAADEGEDLTGIEEASDEKIEEPPAKKKTADNYPAPTQKKKKTTFSSLERGLMLWAFFVLLIAVILIVSILMK